VVEVGVDVPAAQAMVIEGADRFGLAQLHQLRGRIGRAPGAKPLCLLLTDARSGSDATRRLDVMAESADGFVIAEEDLKIRGPGEVYGTRQAGMPRLQYANIARDLELLRMARSDAFELLASDPTLVRPEHTTTRSVLQARWAEGRLFGEEAG
jgi:ATP-dependent DNA helicase RecG